jgi:hypothetical protein
VFRVAGWLEDGHIFYGLHGPVVDGPERYRGLICSIIVHEDGSDWRVQSRSSAAFRVGPNIVVRNHQHDFRHSGGTILSLDVKIWRGDGTRIKRSTRQLSRRQMEADGRIDGQNDRRRRSHVLLRGD